MSGDFTDIPRNYESISHVQQAAGQALIGLLGIHGSEDVLDVGCGVGNITRKLRARTAGRVCGIDASEAMIAEALKKSDGIVFEVKSADDMEYDAEFDVVFCNSTLQWFKKPAVALDNIFRALKAGGRVGVQAPAKNEYCPNFIKAIGGVRSDPRTATVFSSFVPPWFFFETAAEYSDFFRGAGFMVKLAWIKTTTHNFTPGQVFDVFSSGASAGYLAQKNYSQPLTAEYTRAFMEILRKGFADQAGPDGTVPLTFHRIYLIAEKR